MELFREEYLTIQDDYLRVDPSREGEENDDDLEYSNDDLGENTEVTPLGDAIKNDEINDYIIDPDDEEEYGDDEDLDVEEVEDEDVVDIKSQIDPSDDDDDLLNDDDDLLADDDDLDTTIAPDLDDDDDLLADDDDDILDDEDEDDDITARTSIDTNADFASRSHGRTTGTMLNHEPGLPGTGAF
jgi:hypothetical protein